MPLSELLRVIDLAVELGVTSYRISGGEPMIFPDRVFSVLAILQRRGQGDVILNSNGFNLHKHIDRLREHRVRKVKISLDTVDRTRFKQITNTDKIDDVLKSIRAVADAGIGLELNLVLLRSYVKDFWGVLDFCVAHHLSLKVLDLVMYDTFVRNTLAPEEYFRREYYSPAWLEPELRGRFGEPRTVRLSNDRGIPMTEYTIGPGVTLTLKDGGRGSTFGAICAGCTHFPCQEGLFHLSLSAEGRITPCRLRRDLTVDLIGLSTDDVKVVLQRALDSYSGVHFRPETVKFPAEQES
jgi:molybdenum cofactor biosynthesis enzyme MoaA